MDDKKRTNVRDDVIEIDLKRIWQAIWRRAWLIAIAAILCASTFLLATVYLITPKYQSSAMFYVNNSSFSVGDTSLSIDSGDITASKNLVQTYIVILNSRSCLSDVIDYADLDYSVGQLSDMISAAPVNSTEVFKVVITGPDAHEAEKIANAIAYILPKKISDIVEGTSAKVVDYAIVATSPSSPNRTANTAIGFIVGVAISIAFVVLAEVFDNTIRSEEDVEQISNHPVLATVPDMLAQSKGGYYYDGYVKKKGKGKKTADVDPAKKTVLVGNGISFAASEAYKLLRTKLEFSFADDKRCHVIGVSSALAGEGKSLTAVNLAYSLSQLDKRVLIIDCDMRRPSIAEKLEIQRVPGLSNYLTGRVAFEETVQNRSSTDETQAFHVVAAGRVPPNPIELLSSGRMEKLISDLRQYYDYIILDLPPAGEVSDAIVAAKLVDGILVVVCQHYCTRRAFSHAIGQFEFVEARLLGLVVNRVSEKNGSYKYGKRYYKKKYAAYGYTSRRD